MATIRHKFTIEERVWLVRASYQQNADYEQMFIDFTKHFPDTPIPLHQSVWKMVTQFERTGSIADAPQSSCPHSVWSTDNTETVVKAFTEYPQQSSVRVSNQLGIPHSSVYRIMKDIGSRVYHSHLLQALSEDDPDW